jgi:hypothetical protein
VNEKIITFYFLKINQVGQFNLAEGGSLHWFFHDMSKDKITKTNAVRLLERAKIGYELISYAFDEDDLSALHVAEALSER